MATSSTTYGSDPTWWHWTSTSTSTNTITATDLAWQNWTTASITIAGDQTWGAWTTSGNVVRLYPDNGRQEVQRFEPPEQRAAQEAADREYQRKAQEQEQRRIEAQAKAEKILLENLSDVQRAEYKRHRHFFCQGRSGRRFRIRAGHTANVDVIDKDGRITHRICATAGGHAALPDADNMLAQFLHLTFDDEGFERMGNRHPSMDRNAVVAPPLQ